jgi:hypothetical protein
MYNSHQNLIFVKLKLVWQLSRTTNSVNSEIELLHDEVDEAELSFMKCISVKRVYYSYDDGMSMLIEEHNGADEVPSIQQAPPPAVEQPTT